MNDSRSSALPLLVGLVAVLVLGGLVFWLRGSSAGNDSMAVGPTPEAAGPPAPARAAVDLTEPDEFAYVERAALGAEVEVPIEVEPPAVDLEVREAAKAGVRLVDAAVGSPLAFALVSLVLEDGPDAGAESEHRADLRGRVGGIAERIAEAPIGMLVCEPNGTVIEQIGARDLEARLGRAPGGLTLAVNCGPSVLLDLGSDRWAVPEVSLLSVNRFTSNRIGTTYVGTWELVAVHRASAGDVAALAGVGRVFGDARDIAKVGMATTSLDALAAGQLHAMELLPAESLGYKVTRNLQREERLFVGLTPQADTGAPGSIWGAEWVGALCDPPLPYLLEAGERVDLPAVPAGTWSVRLLTNYGSVRGAQLETGTSARTVGDATSWTHADLGARWSPMRNPPFAPLHVTWSRSGRYTSFGVAPDGNPVLSSTLGRTLYRVGESNGSCSRLVRMEGELEERSWEPFRTSDSLRLEGDFDEGGVAYAVTVGVVPGGELEELSSTERVMLQRLGYSEDPVALRPVARIGAESRALRGQTLALSHGEPLVPLRRVVASGAAGFDSEIGPIGTEQAVVELHRGWTGALLVHEEEPGAEPQPWDPRVGWSSGARFRPLPNVAIDGGGPAARTDLFGLSPVRVEGSDEVTLDLPGLPPILAGTGESLRRGPGIVGVPPFDPKR